MNEEKRQKERKREKRIISVWRLVQPREECKFGIRPPVSSRGDCEGASGRGYKAAFTLTAFHLLQLFRKGQ